MNKLLILLLSLCVTSLEAATITNWGAQLPTAVPSSSDVILMQKGGVTYYFTPNQLAASLSTNALFASTNAQPPSAALTNAAARGVLTVSNSNVGFVNSAGAYTAAIPGHQIPSLSNTWDHGSFLQPTRTNYVNNIVIKSNILVASQGDLSPVLSLGGYATTPGGQGNMEIRVAGNQNAWFGQAAGSSLQPNGLTAGWGSSGFGYASVASLTTGWEITGVGARALASITTGIESVGFGTDALHDNVVGNFNSAGGVAAFYSNLGDYNTGWGNSVMKFNTNGIKNTAVGGSAGYFSLRGDRNTTLGYAVQYLATNSSDCVMMGHTAGYWEQGSSKLFIDNLPRASESDGRLKALIYGDFAAATANQQLTVNAQYLRVQTDSSVLSFNNSSGIQRGYIQVQEGGEFLIGQVQNQPLNFYTDSTRRMTVLGTGNIGINTATPLDTLHVVGGIVQTNGGIWQSWSLAAPSAPSSTNAGAVLWNDGTNWCSVFRNHAGVLSTNKLSMTAWP